MKRRLFPRATGSWRHRFLQIAREMQPAAVAAAPVAGLRVRARPGAAVMRRPRARPGSLAAA